MSQSVSPVLTVWLFAGAAISWAPARAGHNREPATMVRAHLERFVILSSSPAMNGSQPAAPAQKPVGTEMPGGPSAGGSRPMPTLYASHQTIASRGGFLIGSPACRPARPEGFAPARAPARSGLE